MDRDFVYDGALGQSIDVLSPQVNAMSGLGKLSEALLGLPASAASGLNCIPSTPAALTVQVLPGQLYATETVDAVAFGDLAVNPNPLLKQFVKWVSTTLSCPAPTTTGFAINYLIEVQPVEVDGNLETLEYFNPAIATDPTAAAWSGPNNSGAQQPTTRTATLNITAKAGVAAAAGTQVTPAPDAGYFGLWVVTVTQGQLTITSGNISVYGPAVWVPNLYQFLPLSGGTMTGKLTAPIGFSTYVSSLIAAGTILASWSGQFIELSGTSAYTATLPTITDGTRVRYSGIVNNPAGVTLATPVGSILMNGSVASTFVLPQWSYFDIWFDGSNWEGFACGPNIYAVNGASGQATGTLIKRRVFTTSQTYIPTAGTNKVRVTVVGGGGAGGGTLAMSASQFASGGGAGAGGVAISDLTTGFSGVTMTVGATGAGATGAAGGNGGSTSFGALLSATGGVGGNYGNPQTFSTVQAGGAGGVGTGGNVYNAPGMAGAPGVAMTTSNQCSGFGGASYIGAGASGTYSATLPGIAAVSYGAGGSGACGSNSGIAEFGGWGGSGVIIIEEYA